MKYFHIFVYMENSNLINLAFVSAIADDKLSVILKPPYEKAKVPIARRRRKDVVKALIHYRAVEKL